MIFAARKLCDQLIPRLDMLMNRKRRAGDRQDRGDLSELRCLAGRIEDELRSATGDMMCLMVRIDAAEGDGAAARLLQENRAECKRQMVSVKEAMRLQNSRAMAG